MAGTKRAAPSRRSSPDPGLSKRARIDQNHETKAQDEQDETARELQQLETKKYEGEAREDQELRVKKGLGVEDEAKTNIINQSEPVVTAHNSHDPSRSPSRVHNDENLPQTHLELHEVKEQDEKLRVEDEAALYRLEVAVSAPKDHDQSNSSSSNTGTSKRAQLELMVEIETNEELALRDETGATASEITSDNVGDGLTYDPRAHDLTVQETVMTSVEPVELASEALLSNPANPGTKALEFTDQNTIGRAASYIDGTNAQQLSVSRARSPRSPTPSPDPRIALWKDERRSFAGSITINQDKATAARTAHMASQTPLFINGVPQLKLFGDGSIKNGSSSSRPEHGWTTGGYRVTFRNPFEDTVHFVARDENPIRFLEHPSVNAYQQGVDNDYVLEEEGEIYDGPSRLVDFTILCFGVKKAFSVPQVELAAVSQCLETAIRLYDEHHPPTSVVTILSDSRCVINRIKRGVVTCPRGAKLTLWNKFSNPLVQTIIWQSHYLWDRGCELELTWNPRCSALGPSIADAAATAWKEWREPEETEWSQRNLLLDVRDGIMDKLNETTNDIIRAYEV